MSIDEKQDHSWNRTENVDGGGGGGGGQLITHNSLWRELNG